MKDKKSRAEVFNFGNEPLRYGVFVRVGGTWDDAKKWANRLIGSDMEGDKPEAGKACVIRSAPATVCMWFVEPTTDIGILTHESFHAVFHAMRAQGVWPLDYENEEVFAYTLDYTVRMLAEGMRLKVTVEKPARKKR